jgi:chemotaxis protein histidine kinase CheA
MLTGVLLSLQSNTLTLNRKRSNRLNEMAKQQEYEVCDQCQKELQLKVKFCPFCGVAQSIQSLSVMPKQALATPKEEVRDTPSAAVGVNPSVQTEDKPTAALVIKHITKQGKELSGIIVVGSSLELMRTYDHYAFKKGDGVFVRLRHLAKIPNEYLSLEQYQLKFQNGLPDLDPEPDSEPEQAISTLVPNAQSSSGQVQPTPLDSPKPKTSSFKYIAIAFIVLVMVIFFMFSNQESVEDIAYVEEEMQVDSCEDVNAEINSLLNEKMPTRALSIIKLNQEECKSNASFVQLVVSAEAQTDSAKEKLILAKEYVQAGNLELAHQTLLAALELDSELVGGIELLPQLEAMIEAFNLQEAQQLEEVSFEDNSISNAVESVAAQNPQQDVDQIKRLVQAERERAEVQHQAEQAQHQAEQAQRQAEQAQKNRQQALEKERKQAEELARKQAVEAERKKNEERLSGQLSRAERALNTNNYGLAKSLARDVLSVFPNHSQAKRILRQAEAGEAAAFDEMIIQ